MYIEQNIGHELARLRRVAWRMDALFYIPRTNYSVGLDNLLGLIPVVGDVATAAPSAWIIWRAYKLGATPGALAYMVSNMTVDIVIGSIPIIGDIFDVAYNANIRNYRLLEKNLANTAARARDISRRDLAGPRHLLDAGPRNA
jgi:hypothetical protein|tara:strand:- start:79 stop:507 length:429 start_codon:yes stop_codon:yes gene_type:complete